MAIRREVKYAMNLGTFKVPSSPTIHFVGGSPVVVSAGSFTYGEKGTQDWLVETEITVQGVDSTTAGNAAPIGIAWFAETGTGEQFLPSDTVAVLIPPVYATLFQGENEETPPFDPSQTYNVGDLLRPTNITVGGKNYAVWTNAAWAAGPAIYYGRVLAVEGTGASAVLVVLFETIASHA